MDIEEKVNPRKKFKYLKDQVSAATLQAVKAMGFKIMTDIQAEVLPEALDGADVVATAKTGSGKTLAFLIPAVETVIKCMEKQVQGVHIVVATPGRLFDHMRTKEFDYRNVCCLVLDEADKIFQYGFEEDLKQIINRLPSKIGTNIDKPCYLALPSQKGTDALIKSAMKEKVHNINTDEDNLMATVEGLKQGYAVCETEYRLWWLHKLLKKTRNFKVMVFFSSCKSVEFHHEFFSKYCEAAVLCIHGKMSQTDRTDVITNFYNAEKVALFCTDLAARGLDIPAVDWIVQFDPPSDANEYIHRVGRTARGMGAEGNAVILLRPDEVEFVSYLKESKIYLDKYESWDKFANLQPKLDAAMSDPQFHELAVEAFQGYMRAFEVKKLKHIFNLITMDVDAVARSFGLKERPDVDVRKLKLLEI
ncbi:hypothetical protein HW555_004628 [Spodoptera exigua]|uniref:ATP-dependent RNA helicase n=1 Tax=Spodoptera exigua TaxID=7107 RepID=A0A835GKQ1_SPOEX|nr:hypothetical protein HW555_004628 [Spodoptera exigua]